MKAAVSAAAQRRACFLSLLAIKKTKNKKAQRRAAAETAAFIRVVRYNDESSFDLDNDFEMNPASTKTWPYMGPIWATI